MYSGTVMTILLCHEMGHFVQAWRYGVYASLPYFIPMPLTPIGTFGAVIGMEPRRGDRKAVFDIGITGPLAGLLPTFIFLLLGLYWSEYRLISQDDIVLGAPCWSSTLPRRCTDRCPQAVSSPITPSALPLGWAS